MLLVEYLADGSAALQRGPARELGARPLTVLRRRPSLGVSELTRGRVRVDGEDRSDVGLRQFLSLLPERFAAVALVPRAVAAGLFALQCPRAGE